MNIFRKIKNEIEYYIIKIYKYFKVKLYLDPKLKKLYWEHRNDKDEFNKSLDIQLWYCLYLTKKQLKKYLSDLAHRREILHNSTFV